VAPGGRCGWVPRIVPSSDESGASKSERTRRLTLAMRSVRCSINTRWRKGWLVCRRPSSSRPRAETNCNSSVTDGMSRFVSVIGVFPFYFQCVELGALFGFTFDFMLAQMQVLDYAGLPSCFTHACCPCHRTVTAYCFKANRHPPAHTPLCRRMIVSR
jgi:hypothetical protein